MTGKTAHQNLKPNVISEARKEAAEDETGNVSQEEHNEDVEASEPVTSFAEEGASGDADVDAPENKAGLNKYPSSTEVADVDVGSSEQKPGSDAQPSTLTPTGESSSAVKPSAGAGDSKKRKRSSKKARKSESAVVYLSRVPPGLDVGAARALLSRTGALGRVWLRAEDAGAVAARRQLGGRRRSGFSDGWVEYARRRDAKGAVALLNGQPMVGAKRGGRWKNDLWNLKLLPRGYSWDDLVEETCGSKRERVLRVKAAVAASRREKIFVEERADLAKRIAAKEGRAQADADAAADGDEDATPQKSIEKRIVRRFRQRQAVADEDYEDDIDERRAREAARRLESGELEAPAKKAKVDEELVRMLFGKKGGKASAAADVGAE